ncbi:MAG: hypothetical protein NXI32_21610 [bacterium]|nr:hypothetical protein [bacterium]
MDQLKPFLAACKKHLFWILTGTAVVLGGVGFFLASSTLSKLYEEQEKALNGHYDDLKKVQNEIPRHPNDISKQHMQEKIDKLAEDVRAAWEEQYRRQERYLVWPDSIRQTNPALVAKLDSYRPVELKTTYPEEPKDVTKGLKQAYARYFDLDMPRLAKIIGVEWVGEASSSAAGGMYGGMYGGGGGGSYGGGGYGGGGYGGGEGDDSMYGGYGGAGGGGYGGMYGGGAAASNKPRDLVTWPKTSQDELLSNIKMWQGDTPNIYEILYTQENMWILEGLLNIIRKTNLLEDGTEPTANFQCAIKEIEFLRIGKSAGGQAGAIDGAAAAGGGMYGGMGYGGGSYGGGEGSYGGGSYGGGSYGGGEGEMDAMMDEMYSQGMGGGAAVSRDPADNRYVDANFTPVTGEDLRAKMQSSEPDDAYFAVAKRIPVRMRFAMDQRKIPGLIANCGNADLMLEVRQIRVGDTPPASGGAGGGGGMYGGSGGYGSAPGAGGLGGVSMDGGGSSYGGGGYGGEGDDSMYGGYGGGGGGMYGGGGAAQGGAADFDVDVEVFGIVYLFNPVDIERLGLNKVTEDTQLDDTVEAPQQTAPAQAPVDGQPTTEQPAGDVDDGTAPSGDASQPTADGDAGQAGQAMDGADPNAGQAAGTPAGQAARGQGNAGAGPAGRNNAGPGRGRMGPPNAGRNAGGGNPNAPPPNSGPPEGGPPGNTPPPAGDPGNTANPGSPDGNN